jgi:hypothetical protein
VPGEIAPVEIRSKLFRLGEEGVCQHLGRQKALKEHAFVLFPILTMYAFELESLQTLLDAS